MLAHGLLNALFQGIGDNEFIELLDKDSGEIRRYGSMKMLERDFTKPTKQPWQFRPYMLGTDQKPASTNCVYAFLRGEGDDPAMDAVRRMVLPPTYIVERGLGYDFYWMFEDKRAWEEIGTIQESVQNAYAELFLENGSVAMGALPIPSTPDEIVTPVQVLAAHHEWRYQVTEVSAAVQFPPHIREKLTTKPPGRAEKRAGEAFEMTRFLQRAGLRAQTVSRMWTLLPIGVPRNADQHPLAPYLNVGKIGSTRLEAPLFIEDGGVLYAYGRSGKQIVADFSYDPKRLLYGEELIFIGTLHTFTRSIDGVQLPKSAFSRSNSLLRVLTGYDAQWRGTDGQVRKLWSYLRWRWQRNGGDRARVVGAIGRHGKVWVLPHTTITEEGSQSIYEAGVVAKVGGTWPNLEFQPSNETELDNLLEGLASYLPGINTPSTLWPILGWFMATPVKSLLKSANVKYPHLMLYGMSGAGKTSTIKSVMMPLIGYGDPPEQYDCGLSPFAILKVLGSTNASPVFLSEFRRNMLTSAAYKNLKHTLLLAYDGGQQAKGKRDLTTESYPLLAPIVLDGEDVERDHAVRMRSIIVNMRKNIIQPGSEYYTAYTMLQLYNLGLFALPYIRYTLTLDKVEVKERYDTAIEDIKDAFPRSIHDQRVRSNLAVCMMGARMFAGFMAEHGYEMEIPDPVAFLDECLHEVVERGEGEAASGVDEFIETIANHVILNPEQEDFFAVYYSEYQEVWFHLQEAARWFLEYQTSIQQSPLMIGSLKSQMGERTIEKGQENQFRYLLPYKSVRRGRYVRQAYGISLIDARQAGLQIASEAHDYDENA